MENPEEVLNLLDEFAKLKSKEIPNDLEEYLLYVAASGDPVYQWSLIKSLYRQKLINVITEFYEMCPVRDIPRCPNVDPFNYETMKNSLLKRLDSFSSAPFTIQRISELLTTPRKQYNRVDKFMRAIEKNIWVVSTREPGNKEPANAQETSTNLVNGVSPRVCVTVKHPKRVKSIGERLKSGHAQLIDDEEEDVEMDDEIDDYEPMEVDSSEILPNNDTDDTSLQCTSVKDLIEKYENGTIFSNTEEKTDFDEKSAQLEESSGEVAPTSETTQDSEPAKEAEGETESEPITSETPAESEPESESVPLSLEQPSTEETTETSTPSDSAEDVAPDTQYEETEKESAPVVAADSSSDIPVQENQQSEADETTVKSDEPVLDSTSDISADESQPQAESSSSSSEVSHENEQVTEVEETSTEPSTSEILGDVVKEESEQTVKPSSDSVTESQTKEEVDTAKEAEENETESKI